MDRVKVNMKYKILNNKSLSKKELKREFFKWLLYSFSLIIFYMIMRSGAFSTWQPFLIIPLTVAVSLNERELSSCVFALFGGYFIDIACRFLFGFSAVWLMLICVGASLLSRNLIRVNFLNFFWITTLAVILEFSMIYLFYVVLWNKSDGNMIFDILIIPSIISTIVLSPLIYLLIKNISGKFNETGKIDFRFSDSAFEDDDSNIKI